jgi:hypothetical protein
MSEIKPQSDSTPPCCSGGKEDEIFYLFGYTWVFNVNLANEIVRDGREPVELEDESLRYCVDTTDLIPEHIGHVNPERPGVIAHVSYTTADGEVIRGHALIDGNHRAARCLELGRPFFVYILSEEESEQIVVRRPQRGTIDESVIPAKEAGSGNPNPTAVAIELAELTHAAGSLQH